MSWVSPPDLTGAALRAHLSLLFALCLMGFALVMLGPDISVPVVCSSVAPCGLAAMWAGPYWLPCPCGLLVVDSFRALTRWFW